jgi:hypothetical protein
MVIMRFVNWFTSSVRLLQKFSKASMFSCLSVCQPVFLSVCLTHRQTHRYLDNGIQKNIVNWFSVCHYHDTLIPVGLSVSHLSVCLSVSAYLSVSVSVLIYTYVHTHVHMYMHTLYRVCVCTYLSDETQPAGIETVSV